VALHAEPVDVDAGDARAEPDLDAQALQVSAGAARQLRDLAGELNTRRPRADDRERQQRVAPLDL
jgi:hypothetical protein